MDIPLKKSKLIDEPFNLLDYHQYQTLLYAQYRQQQQMSAFRPWAQMVPKHLPLSYGPGLSYLSQEPPILQNPERVVRISECERFERTFQPNVALAPRRHNSSKDRDRDRSRSLTTEIQIKQERPSTPPELLNSPELRVASPMNHTHSPFSPEALSGSNEITSSTSPVLVKTGSSLNSPSSQNSVPMESLHQNHRVQQSPIMLKNGGAGGIISNSEFELSTDTDDDSMTGEPDSSNANVPLEVAADILKDIRPEEKERVLNIIKLLVLENVQLKNYSIENQNLMEELRRKDDQICELLRQQQTYELQQHQRCQQQISMLPVEPSVIARPENIDAVTNDDQHQQQQRTEKVEVIMKPLKKSARRSPEESVVVLKQPKREDIVIEQPKDSISRIYNDGVGVCSGGTSGGVVAVTVTAGGCSDKINPDKKTTKCTTDSE